MIIKIRNRYVFEKLVGVFVLGVILFMVSWVLWMGIRWIRG
jgi:hypothetical protein